MTHDEVYEFLNNSKLGVISTIDVNNNVPEAALIGFGQTHDLELIFGTSNKSRKYHNLYSNPRVAFVIGWDNGISLQYEGMARELLADEIDIVKDYYWAKSPSAAKSHDDPDRRYFVVKPSWIRMTDVKKQPWEVRDIKF